MTERFDRVPPTICRYKVPAAVLWSTAKCSGASAKGEKRLLSFGKAVSLPIPKPK